jgi:hypothetical protein
MKWARQSTQKSIAHRWLNRQVILIIQAAISATISIACIA